jgi:hypothetical protein
MLATEPTPPIAALCATSGVHHDGDTSGGALAVIGVAVDAQRVDVLDLLVPAVHNHDHAHDHDHDTNNNAEIQCISGSQPEPTRGQLHNHVRERKGGGG